MKNGSADVKGHKWFKEINWDDVYKRKLKVGYCQNYYQSSGTATTLAILQGPGLMPFDYIWLVCFDKPPTQRGLSRLAHIWHYQINIELCSPYSQRNEIALAFQVVYRNINQHPYISPFTSSSISHKIPIPSMEFFYNTPCVPMQQFS